MKQLILVILMAGAVSAQATTNIDLNPGSQILISSDDLKDSNVLNVSCSGSSAPVVEGLILCEIIDATDVNGFKEYRVVNAFNNKRTVSTHTRYNLALEKMRELQVSGICK